MLLQPLLQSQPSEAQLLKHTRHPYHRDARRMLGQSLTPAARPLCPLLLAALQTLGWTVRYQTLVYPPAYSYWSGRFLLIDPRTAKDPGLKLQLTLLLGRLIAESRFRLCRNGIKPLHPAEVRRYLCLLLVSPALVSDQKAGDLARRLEVPERLVLEAIDLYTETGQHQRNELLPFPRPARGPVSEATGRLAQ